MSEYTVPLSMNPEDVYAEGEVSPSEANHVITNLTDEPVGITYDGPGGLEDIQLVEPHEAIRVLNTALEYSSEMTPEEHTENMEKMEKLGFDNSKHGRGSVVQELVEGSGEKGAETPVYLMADFNEAVDEGVGAGYAIVVEDLQTAIRSTEEELGATLTLEGNIKGEPKSKEDVQDYARTVGGELSEAYQTIADL